MRWNIITLLTDFGDFYPGVMKGMILKINPKAKIVDITHSVEPQNVLQGAFLLWNCSKYFENSIHVAVVDPEVGSDRDAIIGVSKRNIYIAPDNGILSGVMDEIDEFYRIIPEKTAIYSRKLSSTFHGRDVFAPASALVSIGRMGEIVEKADLKPVKLEIFKTEVRRNALACNIVYVDSFGNIVTDLREDELSKLDLSGFYLDGVEIPLVRTFSDVEVGKPLAYIGSFDTLEIAVREGSASQKFGLKSGRLELEFRF